MGGEVRICLISPNFPVMPWPCGAADFVDQFSSRLASAGHAVTVVTSNPAALSGGKGREIHIIRGDWGLAHLLRVSRWVKRQSFEVVDLQYEAAMYSLSAKILLIPWLIGRGPARVLTLHSQNLPAWGGRWWRYVQLLPHEAVIFYSEQFRGNMSRRFPKWMPKFHLQGFPANIVRSGSPDVQNMLGKIKARLVGSSVVLLYFGHIGPDRGLEDVLEVLGRLGTKGLRPKFVLASQFNPEENAYHRNLLGLIRAGHLEEQVAFPGRLGNEEVSQLFEAADVCVLPFPEGASFKNGSLAAAIEHCVPTVTTVSSLTEQELLKGGALQTYSPGEIGALEHILESLLRNPEKCVDLRNRMRAMRDLVSWDAYISVRLKIYEEAGFAARGLSDQTC